MTLQKIIKQVNNITDSKFLFNMFSLFNLWKYQENFKLKRMFQFLFIQKKKRFNQNQRKS
jgi:hypothetical protein